MLRRKIIALAERTKWINLSTEQELKDIIRLNGVKFQKRLSNDSQLATALFGNTYICEVDKEEHVFNIYIIELFEYKKISEGKDTKPVATVLVYTPLNSQLQPVLEKRWTNVQWHACDDLLPLNKIAINGNSFTGTQVNSSEELWALLQAMARSKDFSVELPK